MADYVREGEAERDRIIAEGGRMVERIRKQAEEAMNQEVKAAKERLIREMADLSAVMAEDLIRKNIDREDQERLVTEYLEKGVSI